MFLLTGLCFFVGLHCVFIFFWTFVLLSIGHVYYCWLAVPNYYCLAVFIVVVWHVFFVGWLLYFFWLAMCIIVG